MAKLNSFLSAYDRCHGAEYASFVMLLHLANHRLTDMPIRQLADLPTTSQQSNSDADAKMQPPPKPAEIRCVWSPAIV